MKDKLGLIFTFLRYIQPVWYQNLIPNKNNFYWVDYNSLDTDDQTLIDFDLHYTSNLAALRDAAYQAFHKGIMVRDASRVLPLKSNERVAVVDEYRFVRKYFHALWAWYILFFRLLSWNNPVTEIVAFFNTVSVKRIDVFARTKIYPNYRASNGVLALSKPLVSIIIPTLNRYEYLNDVLNDLEQQTYTNIEVIVVDQSEPFSDSVYQNRGPNLQVIRQAEKALWKARNEAIKRARGKLLLLYDDDSRIKKNWVEEHIRCLDYFHAHVSAGVSISVVGNKVPKHYSFFRWADQLDTGNVMIRREVFEDIGLFDRQFEKQRLGDGEFGLRAYLNGYISISNPLADRLHLKAESGGLRQMGSWDAFRTTSWFAPRPVPSVLYLIRNYFGNKFSLLDLLIKIPMSIVPFKYKGNYKLYVFGGLIAILVLPIVLIQVLRSWKKSSVMLKQGPKIEKLSSLYH